MSARTRRGLALSWSALFVFSLILQYFTFAFAPAALAVHDEGLFELDGNTANDAAVTGDDWDSHPGATGNRSIFITDGFGLGDDIFTTGASKDDLNTSGWKWTTGSVQDKNDIEHAYAVSYVKSGHSFVYFGLDRYSNNGDAFTGFWFFKGKVGPVADGSFSAPHQVGDLLVQADFTNGGATSTINLYEWVGTGGDTNGTLNKIGTGQICTGAPVNDKACAVTNQSAITPSWSFDDKGVKDAPNPIPVESFFEGGIDLDDLFGGSAPCFSSFLAETRSSQSVDSTLSDFAGGNFDTCVPPTISTDSSRSTVAFGQTVTDTATLSGTDGPASGSVKFFVCGPSGSAPDCSTGGTQVGSAVAVTTSSNGGTATSSAYTPTQAGFYCWRAEYTPDSSSQYLAGSHTNQTTECFQVVKNNPTISTAANQTVSVGASISDSATLAGATSDAGGTITFKAYGPDDATCSNAAAFTSSAVAVSGNGTYGPVSFTPATAGTYRWIASYSGDAKNTSATGQCNDTGETDTVNKVTPQIATQASGSVTVGGTISDTATVSGGLNPTGTVTFKLYGPDDATCATVIFTSANRPLSGGSATSASFTTTQAGTYRWIATYNGDANNNSVSGACNDANESVVVTKTNPGITTQLVGDGKTGASITVPLGTAVHDTSALSGVTATAGGTVHYQVFTDAQCNTLLSDAGTANVVNGVPGNSINVTFNQAGTYYWQADYSGDANNNAASSACNLETVTVDKNIPAISTTATSSVEVGTAIHDVAHLSGGFNPTGTITFNLYGPNDATCSTTAVFTAIVAVSGNGDYNSGTFTPTTAGTYRWIASYSGDSNNASVAGGCNDEGETTVVTPKSPTVTTNASASVQVGGQIHDTAHLAGGFNPTGTMTFKLYGPNDATCANAAIFTDTVTVNGNGDYLSGNFTTTQAGTYRWIANYGGDTNNTATANGCNGANENVIVTPKNPTVTTNASASVTVGGTIHDTATLSGGFNPTGTIHFALYGPNDATCSNEAVFTADVTVNGNGDYQSGDYTATQAGTYRWIANYGGDANNTATANGCNEANENVVVTKANPSIATLATEGAQVGDKIHDVATVSGGYNPTGTVTFKLYGPSDPECDSSAIFTDTVALGGNGTATSGDYTVTEKGNYHWVASYSGDANNESATGACGDEGETTIVNQFNPDITTELHSGNLSGAKITVLFGASVTDQATLTGASATAGGTVTYTVYTDSSCTTVYADAGSKTVTNGAVPPSNAVVFPDAGTYYWQASYGGDAANAPALSACTDEVLTVTTPDLHAVKLVKTNDGSFGPTSTANPGDKLTFQITITNSGDADATNVPVSDDIADVLAHATYNNDCNLSCDKTGTVLSWTIPTIAKNGGSVVLTFSVTLDSVFPDGTTHLPNVVVVSGPGSNCEADSGDADCDTDTTVEAHPDVNVLKQVKTGDGAFGDTSTANPGDVVTWQIAITNTGNADTTVDVSDDISAILAHASYNGDCTQGCDYSAPVLSWNDLFVPAGGGIVLTFSATLDDTFPQGTTHLPNLVVVTGTGSNCAAESVDPDCDTDTTVGANPDLHAVKEVAVNDGAFNGGGPANPGDTLTYRITITNSGDADATSVPVSDDIADILAHASYNDDCTGGCTLDGTTLKWTIPTIAAHGGQVILTFSVDLDSSFPEGTTHLPNVVVVTGPGSNCAAESEDPDCDTDTTVEAHPDLNAVKEVAVNDGEFGKGGAAKPGDTLHYRITITNTGDAPATSVPVADDISALLAHGTYQNDCSNSCTLDGSTLKWTISSIAANGGSVTLTFSVKLSATFPTGTTDLPNVVVVTGPGSNCAAESEDADCSTDNTVTTSAISIVKDVTAVNGQPPVDDPDLHVPGSKVGDTISYTLHYHGEGPINDAVITDVLPAGLQYVAGSASSDSIFTFQSYDSATRTLTWTTDLMLDPKDGNTVDGELTYDVKATEAAAEGPQPLINTATIVGHTPDEEELTDSDTAAVTVLPLPEELTPPPTSTLTPQTGTSNPGFALMLILLGMAAVALAIGFITPVPASVRRRERRRQG